MINVFYSALLDFAELELFFLKYFCNKLNIQFKVFKHHSCQLLVFLYTHMYNTFLTNL